MNQTSLNRLMGPWKRILRNYIFEPMEILFEENSISVEFINTGVSIILQKNEQQELYQVQVWIRRTDWEEFWSALIQEWAVHLDEKTVYRILVKGVEEIILAEDERNNDKIRAVLCKIYDDIAEQIVEQYVLAPIKGLKLNFTFQYGSQKRDILPNLPGNISLQNLFAGLDQKNITFSNWLKDAKGADAFLRIKITAHQYKSYNSALEEANAFLDVIRLYQASHYRDAKEGYPAKSMGILGLQPIFGDKVLLSYKIEDGEDIIFGGTSQKRYIDSYKIEKNFLEAIKTIGFDAIMDALIRVQEGSGNNKDARLSRSISWFAKGTKSLKSDDSYINYAVSLEALLSSGREEQGTLAAQVAALLSRSDERPIYPGWISFIGRDFSSELKHNNSKLQRYEKIKNRMDALISKRNDLVHGHRLLTEAERVDLLTFETLVRNAILSFVDGGWERIEEFNTWRNEMFPDDIVE